MWFGPERVVKIERYWLSTLFTYCKYDINFISLFFLIGLYFIKSAFSIICIKHIMKF